MNGLSVLFKSIYCIVIVVVHEVFAKYNLILRIIHVRFLYIRDIVQNMYHLYMY